MKSKKERKSLNKLLRLIAVFLLLIFLHIVLNFDGICYVTNFGSYESSVAKVTKKTTDLYMLVIPMVEIQYSYNEEMYSERKYFLTQKTFGLPDEEGSVLDIYINKNAPNHPIFRTNFFTNPYNYLILLFEAVCLILIFKRAQSANENQITKNKKIGKKKEIHKEQKDNEQEQEGDIEIESDF